MDGIIDENEYDKNSWKEMLCYIYEHEVKNNFFSQGKTGFNINHPLVKELKLNEATFQGPYDFLLRHELIANSDIGPNPYLILTPKGFDMVFRIESEQENMKYAKVIMFLTFLLAFGTIFPAIKFFTFESNNFQDITWTLIISVFFLIGPLWIVGDILKNH